MTQKGNAHPTTLEARRFNRTAFVSTGTGSTLTIPARVHDMELAGATAVFETSIDDYAEIWVDGELSRARVRVAFGSERLECDE